MRYCGYVIKTTFVLSSGRQEIWDALRAAANALEGTDYGLAQAIIDGANISLPHGGWLHDVAVWSMQCASL